MNVGIVGYGIVGMSVAEGLARIGHSVSVNDIKFDPDDNGIIDIDSDIWMSKTSIINMADSCDVIFICVPTPQKKDGSCDTSIVENIIENIRPYEYKGVIVIKSTVEPGTTQRLIDKYKTHRICFCPEFLRERFAIQDFTESHDLCVIGTSSMDVFNIIKKVHGNLPKHVVCLTPTEAEIVKYYNNIYNATLVTLANSFYELCRVLNADYSKIKGALVNRDHINDMYLDCHEWLRGYGGACLPKDTRAIANLCNKLGINHVHLFDDIIRQNSKFITTVFNGMRQDCQSPNK